MTETLIAENVRKVFSSGRLGAGQKTIAVDSVSLGIGGPNARVVSVAGESGSGKSTLGMLLLGFLTPTSGRITFEGKDVSGFNRRQRREFRRNIQAVFQDPFEVFNPFYKVDHSLMVPLRKFNIGKSHDERRTIIEEAVAKVGLRPQDTLGRYPHQLSGGQRQRVMVARVMLISPRVIVADEPVSMVDASLRATILGSLVQLHREQGISIVYITHDLATAYQVSTEILILYRGVVVERGSTELVIQQPNHPYTRLLVESIPRLGASPSSVDEVTDAPASDSTHSTGNGCVFADRCPFVMPVCRQVVPSLANIGPQQMSACHLNATA